MRCCDAIPATDGIVVLKATWEPTEGKTLAVPGASKLRIVQRGAWDLEDTASTSSLEAGEAAAGLSVATASFTAGGRTACDSPCDSASRFESPVLGSTTCART